MHVKYAAERAVYKALEAITTSPEICPLSDRINLPITFITTCGYEGFIAGTNSYHGMILDLIGNRLDILYLYDFGLTMDDGTQITPQFITNDDAIIGETGGLSFTKSELVNIVYP